MCSLLMVGKALLASSFQNSSFSLSVHIPPTKLRRVSIFGTLRPPSGGMEVEDLVTYQMNPFALNELKQDTFSVNERY